MKTAELIKLLRQAADELEKTTNATVNKAAKHQGATVEVPQIVDTATAAIMLKVTSQTMRRWACQDSGPIKPKRINGRLRWTVEEIRQLLQ